MLLSSLCLFLCLRYNSFFDSLKADVEIHVGFLF